MQLSGIDLRTQFRPGHRSPTQRFFVKREYSVDPSGLPDQVLVLAMMHLSFQQTFIQRRLHGIVALYISKLEDDVERLGQPDDPLA